MRPEEEEGEQSETSQRFTRKRFNLDRAQGTERLSSSSDIGQLGCEKLLYVYLRDKLITDDI